MRVSRSSQVMASISFLEGKKQLVTIRVPSHLGLQQLMQTLRFARRVVIVRARVSWFVITLTSLFLLVYLLGQLYSQWQLNSGAGAESLWSPPASCEHCHVTHPLESSQMEPDLLMVLIHAKADDWKRREAIRQTWVSDFVGLANSPVQYRFVVAGKGLPVQTVGPLLKEAQSHQDLVILPEVTDSHGTLTQRTIEGFKFAVENFRFAYVLKCDDDTYVDLPRVTSELQLRERRDKLYWGYMLGTSRPQSLGRYRETHWVLCASYFPYALGGGYVLSRDLVDLLAKNKHHLVRYRCEDVSVGAWLAPYNIERRHDVRFDTESRSRGCKEVFLVSHKVGAEDMLTMYQSLQLEGTFCSWRTHWHNSNGYLYNWSALPSHCCVRHTGIP